MNTAMMKKGDLSGAQKSAILLIALDVDTAADVLKYLDSGEVEQISAEISRVRNTASNTVDDVLDEFYNMVTAREYVLEGGLEFARAVLEKSFGMSKAQQILEKVQNLTTLRGFDVLKKADSAQLINFLNKEHPQTIALILSHLSPDQTAEALRELPDDIRVDVSYRIATLGKISPQTLKRIEKVVDDMAGLTISQSMGKIGGTKSLAQILNRSSVSLSKDVLDKISEKDEEVGQEIKRLMFMFDDLVKVQDKDLQRILREIDRKELVLALKIVDDKLKNKIYANMSDRASSLLKEELQYLGMVKLKEVETAQSNIIDTVKQLEEAGEISLNLRGNREEVYV